VFGNWIEAFRVKCQRKIFKIRSQDRIYGVYRYLMWMSIMASAYCQHYSSDGSMTFALQAILPDSTSVEHYAKPYAAGSVCHSSLPPSGWKLVAMTHAWLSFVLNCLMGESRSVDDWRFLSQSESGVSRWLWSSPLQQCHAHALPRYTWKRIAVKSNVL